MIQGAHNTATIYVDTCRAIGVDPVETLMEHIANRYTAHSDKDWEEAQEVQNKLGALHRLRLLIAKLLKEKKAIGEFVQLESIRGMNPEKSTYHFKITQPIMTITTQKKSTGGHADRRV